MENKPSFDRTQIIGLVLIGLIFMYFSFTNSSEETPVTPQEQPAEVVTEESVVVRDTAVAVDTSSTPDTTAVLAREAKTYSIENNVLSLTISDRGAQVVEALVKDYQTHDSLPLYMVKDNQVMDFTLGGWNSGTAWFNVVENTSTSLALSTNTPNGPLTLKWSLRPDEYQVDFKVSGAVNSPKPLSLDWDITAFQHEKSLDLENQKTGISFWDIEDGDMEELSSREMMLSLERISDGLRAHNSISLKF